MFDSQYNGYSTDELFFVSSLTRFYKVGLVIYVLIAVQSRIWRAAMEGSFSGTHQEVCRGSRSCWFVNMLICRLRRFSPSNHVHKWSTPELIIHGSKDYRLPETEGISVFQALQQYVSSLPYRLWCSTVDDVTGAM